MLHIPKLLLPLIHLFSKRIPVWFAIVFIAGWLIPVTKVQAQVTLKGTIKNEKDAEPVAFVTVQEKGKKSATFSDTAGNFTITVTKLPATLEFSAVGFDKKEMTVKNSSVKLTVTLQASPVVLDEAVTVGYGTKRETRFSAAPTMSSISSTTGFYRDAPAKYRAAKPAKQSFSRLVLAKEKLKESAPVTTTAFERDLAADKSVAAHDSLAVKTDDTPIKRTSLLTAGEVNDFKKWKMWEDYNATDFKTHSVKWNLFATQRYSVQLQNNDFRAITGETVYLINKETNEIVWTAVSDNTGKAELWNGFSNNSKDKNLVIEVKGEKKEYAAIPFSQGINHIQVNRSCGVSAKVEIAFVVDATGSMNDEIEYLKEELGDILTKISLKEPSLELNTGAVFYRDKGEEYVTRLQPFTNSISNTIGFIKEQSSGGGGDYPEALKEALQEATEKLEWSETARTKIIFLLMDAPPHDEAKNEMTVLIAKAANKGIRIVPVACSGTDKATEFIMRSMALATNGTYLFLTDDSGIGNVHIKPTTDEFKVELLNDLLQRVIEQMCFVNPCEEKNKPAEPVSIYSNTEKVKVFPNPSSGPVTLETDKELKEIFITDFTGKILKRLEVKNIKKQYKIDLSRFPSATYFIRYITKENKTGAEKIILIR